MKSGLEKRRQLEKYTLDECREDHVGLWSVLWDARRLFPDASQEDLMEITLSMLRDLLVRGDIVAGFPEAGGRAFKKWDDSPDAIIARIKKEWEELGRDPNIGEIVWFTAKENA